ncbi:MAG TPA: HAMP domain-containing sensor histidine kinase [Gemmatimonadales bacterium]|nr:HAMP domain-containing sensor histidine kinase [Gemmatimonadales bacterium]
MGEERDLVVVIDDDYAMRLSCQQILAKTGYRVEEFEDGARGLEGVAALKPGLVLVDLKMPGLSGLEVIARLRQLDPTITIVVITGYATIGTAVDAMKAGAYDFLPKPFAPDELRLIVQRGFEWRRLTIESRRAELERELQRRRFVTFVSHQLKTPLVAVHQYLDVLRRLGDGPEAAAKRAEWLDRCLVRTEELQRLIDDWLTLAQLEGSSLIRRRTRVDLKQVLPAMLEGYRRMAAGERVTVDAELPDDAYPVRGDPTCIGVLFDNLLGNAVKYNRRGGSVRVCAARAPGEVVVEVRDTGIGIPAEALPLVFDEFYRARKPNGVRVEGTGLGLPICRRVVTEMGGTIEVESTEGTGSVFRVRLPRCEDDGVEPPGRETEHAGTHPDRG